MDGDDFKKLIIKDSHNNVEEIVLADELSINSYDLVNEMYDQPRKYVYFTSLLENVRVHLESEELKLERIHAELYEPTMTAVKARIDRNPTKDHIESEILKSEAFSEQREYIIYLGGVVKNLQSVVRAFEQRKDMLIQLAVNERKQEEYNQAIKQSNMNVGYQPNN